MSIMQSGRDYQKFSWKRGLNSKTAERESDQSGEAPSGRMLLDRVDEQYTRRDNAFLRFEETYLRNSDSPSEAGEKKIAEYLSEFIETQNELRRLKCLLYRERINELEQK